MATNESLVLNGLQLNDGATYTLEGLTVTPAKKRPEWVTGGDSNGAILGREALYENRTVSGRIRVGPLSTQDLAQAAIGTLLDKFQEAEKGGIDCVWTPANSTKSGTFKVLLAEIESLPVDVENGWFVNAPVLEFALTCKPGIRGTEVVGTPASSTLPLMTVELTGVTGDLNADTRLIITDAATQSRRHVEFGLESRYYPTSSPPSLIVDSDGMVTTGFSGTGATRSGAYDPGAAGSNVIRGTLSTQAIAVCGTGALSHVGSFRIKSRVYCVSADTNIFVRLSWQDGDGPWRSNPYVQVPVVNDWAEIDLGLVRIDPAVLGTQRWQGRVDAYSLVAGDTVDVDYLLMVPAGESYALVRGVYTYQPGVFAARDDFNAITAGTALNARVSPLGGTWATSGVATDFAAADAPLATDETMSRATVSEATRRLALLGTATFTDTEVGADVRTTSFGSVIAAQMAVVARGIDINNYAFLQLKGLLFELKYIVGGSTATIFSVPVTTKINTWYRLRLIIWAKGNGIATITDINGTVLKSVPFRTFTVLATAGALASGKVGLSDTNTTSDPATRYYDNFYAATPNAEPTAIYSLQSLEVRSDLAKREDASGTYYGDAPFYRGSRPTIPPAGAGARKVRIAVKARRNDVVETTDDQIADNLTVQANYTPVFLAIPR